MRRPNVLRATRALLVASALLTLSIAAPAGAASGPALVKDINPTGDSNPSGMVEVGGTLFFAADDGVHGVELWKSDGSAAGTRMVKNIRPYAKSSYPSYLTSFNGALFFMANDGPHGQELWTSDGTKAGTVMVKDIHTGPKDQFGGNSTMLHEPPIVIGNRMFLIIDSCCVGTQNIIVTDGTSAGTVPVTFEMEEDLRLTYESRARAYGGELYFVNLASNADYTGDEYQLWVSDGSLAGTHRVPGTPADASEYDTGEMLILPASGRFLYFYANDRLWKTNGSPGGTKALTSAGDFASMPNEAAYMGNRLYFNGGALWKTDGTAAGTRTISNNELSWLTGVGERLFFVRGSHLWKSDGTAFGTKDMGTFGTKAPRDLVAVGNKLCFAEVSWGKEKWALWESNGTAAGTHKVKTFVGVGDWWELQQAAVGNRLFFGADDGIHGTELWGYAP